MKRKSKSAARRAVVDASSISPETLNDARKIFCEAGASSARAAEATSNIGYLVVGYMSDGQHKRPAKDDHRRLEAMAQQLVLFRETLHKLDPEVRVELNRKFRADELHGEAWRQLTTSARSLAHKVSEFDNSFAGKKRARTDAKQLFRNAASVWREATGTWPSTATVPTGSSTRARSPLHKVIKDLAEESGAQLPPKERKELMKALSLNCFLEEVRNAKAATKKTGQGAA